MWNPVDRTTVQTEENKYRIYSKVGPINYKKSDGTFDTIDHTFNDTTSSIGEISLMDKGIMSVGKRKGNNPTKVVGIRPDINQHLGTQQLEFSLINVELDGESQSFNVETDLEIQLGPAQVAQLVKVNKDFNNFKIEFDIHNTGLELQNSKYSSTTTIRKDFDFNLTNLGEIDASTTSLTLDSLFSGSKSTPHIDLCTTKITNNYITTGQYSIEEEFGDNDLSNYNIDTSVYSNGSSVYYKDCIIFVAKSYNIEEDLEQIMINNLCNLYGLENFDDGGIGQYLTKDNKKVIGYFSNPEKNIFHAFINTKAIPDDVKTLFQKKTFDDTSFLDITLSDFNTTITNHFNNNIEIQLDTNYYQPINNKFVFKVKNKSFYINLPTLFDESYNVLDLGTTHSLKQNDDGTYRYTKYFSMNGYLKNTHNIKYIDADLAADSAEVRTYFLRFPSGGGNSTSTQYTAANQTTTRNATDAGSSTAHGSSDSLFMWCGFTSTRAVDQFATAFNCIWRHTPITFDTSGISDAIGTATLKIKGGHSIASSTSGPSDHHLIALKADLGGTNDLSNFNDIVGHTSGWGASDVTEYSGEAVVTNYFSSPAFQDITLNSTARSDIQNTDEVEIMMMEKEEYYDDSYNPHSINSSITSAAREFRSYSIIASTSANRPYIEYATGDAPSGYGHKVAGVAAASISKVKGVATANIGKVIGVD